MAKQRGLGKGLSSLIPTGDSQVDVRNEEVAKSSAAPKDLSSYMRIDELEPNPFQPRKTLDTEALENLAASIREHGIIQPVLIRNVKGNYHIVAGERRWRAAGMAGLGSVPVKIVEITDEQAMELALVENLQREDLTSMETARGIQELVNRMSLTHEEVAQRIGLSRTAVTNKLRLLQLPDRVIEMLENSSITEGHARALLSLPSADKIMEYADMAVQKNLNVRQLEEIVRNAAAAAKIASALPRRAEPVSDFQEEIDRLKDTYKLTVRVGGSRKNMGLFIKGLKRWQVQMFLEFIENNKEELFPRE